MRLVFWTGAVLVVLVYAAAGLSLLLGTRERRPSGRDRLFGIGALIACALLLGSYPLGMLFSGVGVIAAALVLFRVFGSRTAPGA